MTISVVVRYNAWLYLTTRPHCNFSCLWHFHSHFTATSAAFCLWQQLTCLVFTNCRAYQHLVRHNTFFTACTHCSVHPPQPCTLCPLFCYRLSQLFCTPTSTFIPWNFCNLMPCSIPCPPQPLYLEQVLNATPLTKLLNLYTSRILLHHTSCWPSAPFFTYRSTIHTALLSSRQIFAWNQPAFCCRVQPYA